MFPSKFDLKKYRTMKNCIPLVFFLMLSVIALSQPANRTLIIEGETVINDLLDFETQYLEDSFQEGTVFYKDGKRSNGKFNYNLLLNEIHFIDQENETRALVNRRDITHITIGKRVFRYIPKIGYAEEIVRGRAKLLLKRKVIAITETRYTGVYGTTTHSTNVRPVDNFNLFRGTAHRFDADETLTVRIKYSEDFYLENRGKISPFNNVKDAEKSVGRRNIRRLNEFLRSQGVNFKNLEDLTKVVGWISENISQS